MSTVIGEVHAGPKATETERGRTLQLPNGTLIDPATEEEIEAAKSAWLTDLRKRFALDLKLQIIEKKAELKALQLRLRAERVASPRTPKRAS